MLVTGVVVAGGALFTGTIIYQRLKIGLFDPKLNKLSMNCENMTY